MNRRIAIILLGGLALVSGLIVQPAVHEGGHFLAGKVLGAEVREVVWTPLGGTRPHVLFGQTPGHLIPWINAAGIFLPALAGSLLMIFWLGYCERWGYWTRAAVIIPAVFLLMGNLGPLGELFESPDPLNHHMYPLAHYLGLSGMLSLLFQIAPAVLSVVFLILCLRKVRSMKRKAVSDAGSE